MFYFVGVGLAFFLNVLLLSKRNKNLADWVLACWLLVMMLHLLFYSFFQLRIYPQWLGVELPMPLVHGPLLYLYTLALTRGRISGIEWALHLALPTLFYFYLIHFFALSTTEKVNVYDNNGAGYETFLAIRGFCIPLSGIFYVTLSTLVLRNHRRSIRKQFSSTERINLVWLQYLIGWIAAIWIFVMLHADQLIFGATVVFIFFIGYFGIRQVGIFSSKDAGEIPQIVTLDAQAGSDSMEDRVKYQKSGLTPENSTALQLRLSNLMLETRAYCESEISLAELAARLDVPANHLSQVLNERENKSFYDYINTLRIEEFLRTVAAPESRKLTLYGLAQQCGFNSKSSFNRYFKKVTGKSPSEYVKSQGQTLLESELTPKEPD